MASKTVTRCDKVYFLWVLNTYFSLRKNWIRQLIHTSDIMMPNLNPFVVNIPNCWFSRGVTKIQTTKQSILPRFYFHDVLEQLKGNFHANSRYKRVLGFVIEYAWISKLLRDEAFTWRPRELSCRLKMWRFSRNFAI